MRLVESGWERPKIMRVYPGFLDRSVSLWLLYSLDRMKQIIVRIADDDDKNNLVKFEKDSLFYL